MTSSNVSENPSMSISEFRTTVEYDKNDASSGGNEPFHTSIPSVQTGSESYRENILPEKKIDYQHELVMLFFDSMLENIVDNHELYEPSIKAVHLEQPEDNKDDKIKISSAVSEPAFQRIKSTASRLTEKSVLSGYVSGLGEQLSHDVLIQGTSRYNVGDSNKSTTKALTTQSKTSIASKKTLKKVGQSKMSQKSITVKATLSEDDTRKQLRSSFRKKRSQTSRLSIVETPKVDEPYAKEGGFETLIDDWFVDDEETKMEIKFKNGNVYKGDTKKKLMHGNGKFRWANGTVYEGDFVNGDITGRGVITFPDLGFYAGEFCKGSFHGKGTFNMLFTPMVYDGYWKRGMKHGKGWMLYGDNNWYDGQWEEDERHGYGVRQYTNGARYSGKWMNGKRHGTGTMLWENNDFYRGQWQDGLMHGHGKYIWKVIRNKTRLVFPLENSYDGMWSNGMRNGHGVMRFGVESGAALTGIWKNNSKEGAGTMVCGNGKIIEGDPLFEEDKPIHLESLEKASSIATDLPASPTKKARFNSTSTPCAGIKFQETLQIVHGMVRPKPYCNPLELGIHTTAANIELGYYINNVLTKFTQLLRPSDNFLFENSSTNSRDITPDVSKVFSYSKYNILTCSSIYDREAQEGSDVCSQEKIDYYKYVLFQTNEEKQMRNLITTYFPKLKDIYSKYARLVLEKDQHISFYPVMIRLFLWQFYLDIGIKDKGVSLIDIDSHLAENKESAVLDKHNPFEPICLWQFLMSLIGTCWLLCLRNENEGDIPTEAVLSHLFKKFLDDVVFTSQEEEKPKALCLSKYLHLLPKMAVYNLYLEVGNPPTARDFLQATCVRDRSQPLCNVDIFQSPVVVPKTGSNVAFIGHDIMYIAEPVDFGEKPKEPVPIIGEDRFFRNLKTFRVLGVKKVLKQLVKICPQIKSDGVIVNINYPLTFLEFYEVLIHCALKLVKKEMRLEKKLQKQENPEEEIEKPPSPQTPVSQKLKKKESSQKSGRKNKKSAK